MNLKINYSPFSYQSIFHSSPSRFKIIVGGRRVGKSFSVLHDALKHCLTTPNALCWWVSPTFAEAREVGFEMLKNHTELEAVIQYVNDSRLKVKFINGSAIYFKSADNPKSLRGRGLTHLIIDEAAFVKEASIWKKVLRPALSDRRGTAVLISSPNGRNWFYQQYVDAKAMHDTQGKINTWSYYHWPTHNNPTISEEEIEIAKSELSDVDFRQEYLAEFVTPAGMVYDEFSDDNIVNDFKLLDHHEIYLGADFGYANPSAIVFMAYDPLYNRVTLFDEIYEARQPIQSLLSMIRSTMHKWGIVNIRYVYSDPAGNAAELTSGTSPVDYLRMEGGLQVINKGTLIAPGIALVRSWVRNAKGERRFFISDKCKESIRSMRGYCYEFKKDRDVVDEEPFKDGVNDHACDAIRYFFVNRFDKAKFVAHTLPQDNMFATEKKQRIMKRCVVCKQPFVSKTSKHEPPYQCKQCEEKNDTQLNQ